MAGSEALLASQINGGGCLPPPTPLVRASDALTDTINAFFNDNTKGKQSAFAKYSKDLPPSLAFRSSMKKMVRAARSRRQALCHRLTA